MYRIANYTFALDLIGEQAHEVAAALDEVLVAFRVEAQPSGTPTGAPRRIAETDVGPISIQPTTAHDRLVVELNAADHTIVDYIDWLEPEIVNEAIRRAVGYWWVHGACLLRDDAITLLVAASGTGKTTLSLGLLSRGYRLLTDDIILIDTADKTALPVPRCPKTRPPAPDMLRAVGYPLEENARQLGRYVLLPPTAWQKQSTPAPITRVFSLTRDANQATGITPIGTTDGILGLLPSSNLIALDPTLEASHAYFAETQFFRANLGDYAVDLDRIAEI